MSEQTDPAIFDTTAPALGPGDSDPRSPAKGAPIATKAPDAPGDGGDERFHTLVPPSAGPGDAPIGPLTVTQVPRKKA